DGQNLYIWYANGVVMCCGLDGRTIWAKSVNHGNAEHGNTSSPVLIGDLFIGHMHDRVVAFSKKDGSIAWEQKANANHGSLIPTQIAGEAAVCTSCNLILRA